MHAEEPAAVFQFLNVNRVVEIARILRIDRDDEFISQIFTALELLRVDFFRNLIRFLQGFARKFSRQTASSDDRKRVYARR